MEGKEAIISKILDDANIKKEEILKQAQSKYDSIILEANNWATNYEEAQTELLKKEVDGIISGKELNAELDVKKSILKDKREVLDSVFNKVLDKMLSLDKESYKKLVISLLKNNADCGDVIVLSKDGVLKEGDFPSEVIKEKELSFSNESGDFVGGIKLVGKSSDKDLTFSALIEDKKEQLVAKASKILF